MKMRGRNGKWFRAGDRGTVRKIGIIVALKFGSGIGERRDHVSIWSEDGNRSRRGPVNGKEGAVGRELAANFFFFYVEKTSDVFDHLFMRESHFRACRAVRRGGGDNVRGVASAVGRGRGAGWNKDGRGSVGHCWAIKKVVECVE